MNIFKIIGSIALSITFVGCALLTAPREPATPKNYAPDEPVFEHKKGTFTDERDSKTYETVEIGTQVWMAENLNFEAEGSKCYNNDPANCDKYGRMYDWLTATGLPSKCQGLNLKPDFNPNNKTHTQIDNTDCTVGASYHQGICPSGWHLPKNAEWETLIAFAGGSNSASTRLKASSDWGVYYGSDSYGFNALSGGLYGDRFGGIGAAGNWWTATGGGYAAGLGVVACSRSMQGSGYSWKEVKQNSSANISSFYSVRCIKD